MARRRRLTVGLLMTMLIPVLLGCAPSDGNLTAVIQKYAAPPADIPWNLVGDTEQFWVDVDVLYQAALKGHGESIRTVLVIGTFTDGAVSEGMPDLQELVRRHRETAKDIILGSARLKDKYGYWLGISATEQRDAPQGRRR
jgi:hypothetical protein